MNRRDADFVHDESVQIHAQETMGDLELYIKRDIQAWNLTQPCVFESYPNMVNAYWFDKLSMTYDER